MLASELPRESVPSFNQTIRKSCPESLSIGTQYVQREKRGKTEAAQKCSELVK
jgi:hypothetical protein